MIMQASLSQLKSFTEHVVIIILDYVLPEHINY
jgi:hypothetical protein